MKNKNRGQAAVIDVMMFSIIVIVCLTFLYIFAGTHASTKVKDIKYEAMNGYALNTLQTLNYASARGARYQTIQPDAISTVSDEQLEGLINLTYELRLYTNELDSILTTLKDNVSENNVSALKGDIGEISEHINGVIGNLGGLGISYVNCTEVVDDLNTYTSLFGVVNITGDDPCSFINTSVDDFISSGMMEAIAGNLSEVNDMLLELNNSLDEADVDELVDILEEMHCTLRGVDVKLDRFISYMQLGVREDSTFMDLLPPDVSLETKTVTETVGEALYVEDRLAQSDYLRAVAAIGVRVGFQVAGMGLNNSKNQLGQAIALTLTRKDYKAAARDSVKESLDILLSRQGYDYCFTAETCCSQLEVGSCFDTPDNFGLAKQEFESIEGETGEMTLYIWRK